MGPPHIFLSVNIRAPPRHVTRPAASSMSGPDSCGHSSSRTERQQPVRSRFSHDPLYSSDPSATLITPAATSADITTATFPGPPRASSACHAARWTGRAWPSSTGSCHRSTRRCGGPTTRSSWARACSLRCLCWRPRQSAASRWCCAPGAGLQRASAGRPPTVRRHGRRRPRRERFVPARISNGSAASHTASIRITAAARASRPRTRTQPSRGRRL